MFFFSWKRTEKRRKEETKEDMTEQLCYLAEISSQLKFTYLDGSVLKPVIIPRRLEPSGLCGDAWV
jgi:hypothetical protein